MGADLKVFRADFHVHTVLSPCADVTMIPPIIVQEALSKSIDIIAITDHNSSANITAVQKAAKGTPLVVLPGMELQSKEEIHILCLFDTIDQISQFQEFVDSKLPPIQNNTDFFGEQFVVDETGNFLRRETQLLITSADITLTQAVQTVNELEGIAIPAHVNLKSFGLIYVLGLIPQDIIFSAFEISHHITPDQAILLHPQLQGYPLIQNGDVHYPEDMLGVNEFLIETPTIAEIKLALQGMSGRYFHIQRSSA